MYYVYIYIYIYRERERYIYIYIYTHITSYITIAHYSIVCGVAAAAHRSC